jgi:raffinose/stachyose/melibiose transport system permease protein
MTIIVFNFIGVWNDVQTYLFFSNGDKWPLPMTVYSFFGKYNQYWNLVFADIVIAIIPCVVLFIVGQRYIVSGMTAGAVKG